MRTDIKIKDNFLPQEKFDEIQKIICLDKWNDDNDCVRFPWTYNKIIDDLHDVDKFQFIHVFYMLCSPAGQSLMVIKPILDIINPVSLFRIKANLLTKTSTIIENNVIYKHKLFSKDNVIHNHKLLSKDNVKEPKIWNSYFKS